MNTLALSTEAVLRSGAHDHTGRAPADPQEAMQVGWECNNSIIVFVCWLGLWAVEVGGVLSVFALLWSSTALLV